MTLANSLRTIPDGGPKASDNRGLYVGHATDDIIDAVTRLLDLMARPEDADLLDRCWSTRS